MIPAHRGVGLAVRCAIILVALGAGLFGLAPAADAHTDFESSLPADGSILGEPVTEIRLRFTAASIVAGDGFVVLAPSGAVIQPEVVISEDAREFTLLLDPALTNGVVGVRWSVRAGDAHPIDGAFTFTTTAATRTVDAALEASQPDDPAEADAAGGAVTVQSGTELANSGTVAASALSLDEFLNDKNEVRTAGPVGYLGRLASQAGSLVAIGVVGFALLVSERESYETQLFVYLIRQAAALTVVGAVLRTAALVIEFGNVSDALVSSTGLAVGLRAVGAVALLIGSAKIQIVAPPRAATAVSRRVLATVGGGSFSGAIGVPENGFANSSDRMGTRTRQSPIASITLWPAALIALSFVFDGHTVTKGNHLLTGLVAVVHVIGGAIWLGGLLCLALISRRQRLHDDEGTFLTTVVRFSVVAAWALTAVGAAGLVLAVTILDSVSELWTTAWGRILVAKVLIVGVAAAAGAFNHFVLVPEMHALSAHSDARQSFVRTIAVELMALALAVGVTAFLVAAAS